MNNDDERDFEEERAQGKALRDEEEAALAKQEQEYFANEGGSQYECSQCGYSFTFDDSTTLGELRARLKAHVCYPHTALRLLARPVARMTLHTILILFCCCSIARGAATPARETLGSRTSIVLSSSGMAGVRQSAHLSSTPRAGLSLTTPIPEEKG